MGYNFLAPFVTYLDNDDVRPHHTAAADSRSTILHTAIHELIRLATLPMIRPSPTSGFHSSYYLGLGWGLAEAIWGIVQGWEQLVLYEDVMRSEADVEVVKGLGLEDAETGSEDVDVEELEEAELERRVEILERMRARRGEL